MTYQIDMPPGYPGMIADGLPTEVVSWPAQDRIPYGTAVSLRSGAVSLPTAADLTSGEFLGIAIRSNSNEYPADPLPIYARYDAVPVLIKGRVWVMVEEDVALGDAVGIRTTAAADKQVGAFGKASTSGFTALGTLRYLSSSYTINEVQADFGVNGPTGNAGDSGFKIAIVGLK